MDVIIFTFTYGFAVFPSPASVFNKNEQTYYLNFYLYSQNCHIDRI